MKKNILILAAISAVTFTSIQPAFPKERRKSTPAPAVQPVAEAPVVMTSAHSEAPSTTNKMQGGLGFTTFNVLGQSPGLSAWLNLNDRQSLQFVFGVDGTRTAFQFGGGATYRCNLSGNQTTGFHLAGGLNLAMIDTGAVGGGTDFAVALTPGAGFHFTPTSVPQVMFSLDGGPTFQLIAGKFNFKMASLSSLLGLSVHYFF